MDEKQKKTLMKWRARFKRVQLANNYTANSFKKCHVFVGLSLILFTTITSVLTFANLCENYELVPVITGVLATILAAVQTFMNFSEQADVHRNVARRYGELKKEIEYIINFTPDISDLPERSSYILKKENEIAQDAPNTPSCYWERATKETEEENEQNSIRHQQVNKAHERNDCKSI